MRKIYQLVLGAIAVGTLAACENALSVSNKNNPDTQRALARPTDVENLIVGSYNTFHGATYGNNIANQLVCLGMENYSSLANFAMSVRSGIPRAPINNQRNATGTGEMYTPWVNLHRAARAASLGLDRVNRPDFTFFPTSATQNERARAFAHFVIGISSGELAMVYDSATVINEGNNTSLTTNVPLAQVAYDSVARYAFARLDSAYKHAGLAGTQTIPLTWLGINGTCAGCASSINMTQFRALITGWKARITAGVARSGTDPLVNWDTVLNDANNFLTNFAADVVLNGNPGGGWNVSYMGQLYSSSSVSWHEMHGFMVGMADTSGAYVTWLNAAVAQKVPYQIVTPDKRFPNGGAACNGAQTVTAQLPVGCRTAQQAAAGLYLINRATGNDWFGDAIGNSNYVNGRNAAWYAASQIAAYTIMGQAEIRLLAAEAQYRKGNFAAAAALVDVSRLAVGQLPGLVANGVTTNTATLPGPACVPRVPSASGGVFTTSCGTLLEALKWEKRLETAYTYWGAWYFDSRRWGDLPVGTALFMPVPYQESDARYTPNFYTTGGSGPTATPVGTYGI